MFPVYGEKMNYIFFKKYLSYIFLFLTLIASYYLSRENYLLFHGLSELFSIVISSCIFIIAWVTRKKTENYFFVFLGIAYLFVGFIDLFHTFSYKGMGIFNSHIFYANQLWIAARYLESISLIIFSIFINKKYKINYNIVFTIYLLITTSVILSVFYFKIFPVCFIAGQGQTDFKIISEYIICVILFLSILILIKKRESIDENIFKFIIISLIFTIISEFCFTLYTDNYGVTNVLGHIFKIVSFFFIYKSIIVINLEEPFSLIFSELKNRLEEITLLNKKLDISNKTKNRFFAIIAHDLKNPLNGFKQLLSVLNEDPNSLSEKEKKEYISLLYKL